jgi:hypothetical protein
VVGWDGVGDGLGPGLAWRLLSPPPIATMASGSFVTCGGFCVVCGAACMTTMLAEARADVGSTCSRDGDDDAGGGTRGRWLSLA